MALSFDNSNSNSQSFNSSSGLSFGTHNNSTSDRPQSDKSDIKFEGSLYTNAKNDLNEIGAGIATLLGGIFGYDQDARKAMIDTFDAVAKDPTQLKQFGDALLSTYNLAIDDIGKMPLGEMVGNVLTGAWKHPITALIDVTSLTGAIGLKLPKSIKKKIKVIDDNSTRIKLAEQVAKDNINLTNVGNDFLKQIQAIESKYSPEAISKGMQAIETVGFKKAPKELLPVMQDLSKANDTYKQFTSMAGAEIFDDVDFAAKEMLSKEYGVPFSDLNNSDFMKSQAYKEAVQYVKDNDVQPLFHLKPKVHTVDDLAADKIETNLLERKYGTIDYVDAPKNLAKKAGDFVDKVVRSNTLDSASNLNKKIREYNKLNKTEVKELDTQSSVFSNKFLNELNSELKKTMLAGGTYLGANVLSTTLSILNNFDVNAVAKTFKNLPKFRMVELSEATTPILNYISQINNFLYRPVASVDKYIENIALEYINNYGIDKVKFLQSTIPSRVVATNPVEAAVKSFVPFGNYPLAAIKETAAHIKGRPVRSFVYNQLPKLGTSVNETVQQQTPGLIEADTTKAIRFDPRENKLIQRSTVVTPIQAANMFLLGQQGDAIQVPLFTFLNKLISGKGDPNVFEVEGKTYRVNNGEITTEQGSFSLLPSLSYIGRQLLGPVQFYNQVVVPLMTDKYVRDEQQLFNRLVNDSQYSNMNAQAQNKVTTAAREKLGKRVAGTYEFNYYKPYIPRRIRRKILQRQMTKRNINDILNN
jgi:hypothetical protein